MKVNFIITLFIFSITSTFAQTKFFDGSLRDAAAQAKAEKKYLFVDCYTDWCHWCKVADRTTFSSKEVGEFMSKRFIAVKMDMERGEGVDLGMKYRVYGYPTFLVFSPEGRLISKMFGYTKDDAEFMSTLKNKLTDKSGPSAVSNINDNIKLPEFYQASFTNKDLDRKPVYPDNLIVSKWLTTQTDITSEPAWCVMSRFDLDEESEQLFTRNIAKLRDIYGDQEVDDKVLSIAGDKVVEAVEKNDDMLVTVAIKFIYEYLTDKELISRNEMLFRIRFAEKTENWSAYTKYAGGYLQKFGVKQNVDQANQFAWTLYLNSEDQAMLNSAKEWMMTVIEVDPSYAYLDTYAALLFKTEEYDRAYSMATKAIEIGLKNEEKVAETEELLEKIKEAQKKK